MSSVLPASFVELAPVPALSNRTTTAPCEASASASSLPLPLVVLISGLFQSRSVGPLPANNTTAGYLPSAPGRTSVPGTFELSEVRNPISSLVVSRCALGSIAVLVVTGAFVTCFAAPPPHAASTTIAASLTLPNRYRRQGPRVP